MKKFSILNSQFSILLLLASLLPSAFCPPAAAQNYIGYSAETLIPGGTNNVAFAATNTYTLTLTLTRQAEVAIQLSFSALGTNTSNIDFKLEPSVDGVTFDTQNTAHTITIAANGTNVVTLVTNRVVGAVGYLRLRSVSNPNATQALTNLSVQYAIKR
jgi:hypothetical protein